MEMRVESDSPIFVVGCPRSGTTLVRDLLRSHPRLTFPGESYFVPVFYRAYGAPRDARQAVQLGARILDTWWVSLWQLPLGPEDFADCRSYCQVVCRLYEAWARQENKPRWGDKTPAYLAWMPLLLELFPNAKFIHVYRDGRDVALSWLRTRWDPGNLYVAARLWKRRVRRGRQIGATLPRSTYLEVRYETLLAQPRETMQQVCDFVGEPFDEVVLRPSRLVLSSVRRDTGGEAASLTEIVTGNRNKWKREMPRADRVLFESVAGDLLDELGYETEGCRRVISGPERWMWECHHRAKWFLLRLTGRVLRFRHLVSLARMRWALLRAGLGL